MIFKLRLVIFLIGVFLLIDHSLCNSDKKRSTKSKNKKPSSQSKTTCDSKFMIPRVKNRAFIASKIISLESPESKSNRQTNTIASLKSVETLHDNFKQKCSNESEYKDFERQKFNITWRYEFFESPHCIRIELDLGNITKFKSLYDLNYYMFSYRELSKDNIHVNRQPINESINSLVIHRVHIRPYIVCVTFYKNDFVSQIVNATNITEYDTERLVSEMSCPAYNRFLLQDERIHDVDLCVDIDVHDHFLSLDFDAHHEQYPGELVMVIFIICLLVFVLGVITFANYIIEKPKKRQMLKALREYLQKKTNSGDHNTTNQAQNLNSIIASQTSLSKDKRKDSNPAIVITDYSSSNNNMLSKISESSAESEPLLDGGSSNKFEVIPLNSGFTPITANTIDQTGQIHKVTFNIGETIFEESPSTSNSKLNELDKNKHYEEDLDILEQNEESVKTISHLLDDKPWLSCSSSQANFSNNNSSNINLNAVMSKSHSRSNSLATNNLPISVNNNKDSINNTE